MTDLSHLPQYRGVVRAAKIALSPRRARDVEPTFDVPIEWMDGTRRVLEIAQVSADVFRRGMPCRGDYLVVYNGGYASWLPASAFWGHSREGRRWRIKLVPEDAPEADGEWQDIGHADLPHSTRWCDLSDELTRRGFVPKGFCLVAARSNS